MGANSINTSSILSRMTKNGERLQNLSVAEMLFAIGIFLIPYDAFPVMPSTYRPISIIPLILSLLFLVAGVGGRRVRVLGKRQLIILAFYALVLVINAFRAMLGDLAVDGYIDTMLTLTVGVLAYFSFSGFLTWKISKTSLNDTIDWLFRSLSAAYIIPLCVGFVECLSLAGILPGGIKDALHGFFGGNQPNRLTLTSYEASWASIHLLIAAVSNFCLYVRGKRYFHIVFAALAAVLFVYSSSMQGVLIISCASALYAIWYSYKKRRLLIFIKWVVIIVALVSLVLVSFVLFFTIAGNDAYYATRLLNFTSVDRLIHTDGSSFVRLVFPFICLQMFVTNPLFGVGAGAFAEALPAFIVEDYSWAIQFGEVARYLNGTLTPSAVSLYTRVIGELGLIGAIPFFSFLISSLRCVGKVASCDIPRGYHAVFLCMVLLCSQLQFASFAYLPFWLAAGFLDAAGRSDSQRESRFNVVRTPQ